MIVQDAVLNSLVTMVVGVILKEWKSNILL